MKNYLLLLCSSLLLFSSCKLAETPLDNGFISVDTLVKPENFQKEIDGKMVDLYTLKNDSGLVVKFTNFGARIVSVLMPDKNGKYADITLGYPSIDEYTKDDMYLGITVGRYANRIAKGTFSIDGKEYHVPINNGKNSLHGGLKGFHFLVWDAKQSKDTLTFILNNPDMAEGYPGNLKVKLSYIITNSNELKMEYEATSDKKTVINLTNHAYYNLHGEGEGDILDHFVEIFANQTTPVDDGLIPSGKLAEVVGTPFDFNLPVEIGKRINEENEQLKFGNGYDHNWVLSKKPGEIGLAVRLYDTISGRVVEFYTTEPGVQFYSGNFMTGKVKGKSGKPYNYRSAVAFEPQHFPDSPNHPNFPSTLLSPGEVYKQTSIVKFLIRK